MIKNFRQAGSFSHFTSSSVRRLLYFGRSKNQLSTETLRGGFPDKTLTDRREANLAIAIKCYIDENYRKDISLADISEAISTSKYHILRVFKEYYEMSPIQYLIGRRIDEAKRILLVSQLPIGEIADRVGYNSLSNFTLQFRKKVGLSPNQFRMIGENAEDENPNEWMQVIH